jgi:NarL family two-component system response regulator YdfI
VIRVLVVAPALAVRAGLRALLGEDEDVDVLAESAWLGEVDELPGDLDVLVLVDTGLTGVGSTREDLESLLESAAQPAVLLLTSESPAPARLLAGLDTRAWGVLPLDSTAEELHAALLALHHGLLVGPPELVEALFTPGVQTGELLGEAPLEALTERELQVLQLLAQGLANKQIAVVLGISEHTVKFHVSGIFAKLGAASRTEAVRLGVRQGLIIL